MENCLSTLAGNHNLIHLACMTTYRALVPVVLAALGGLVSTSNAATLSTTFASTELGSSNWSNVFNLTVSNPLGVQITALTVHISQSAPPRNLDVYVRPNTYVGSETNPGNWTLISSGTSSTAIANGADLIDITDFTLPQGTYGFALVNTNYQVQYTTGATDYNNADLVIDNGVTVTGPLAGGILTDKTWNGTITYNVVPEPSISILALLGSLTLARRRKN